VLGSGERAQPAWERRSGCPSSVSWHASGDRGAAASRPAAWLRPHSAADLELLLGGKGQLRCRPVRRGPVPGCLPTSPWWPVLPGPSWAARCGTWPARRPSGSSWTSAPACPHADSTHEIAQRVARSLGSSTWTTTGRAAARPCAAAALRSATDYLDADLRDPGAIIAGAAKTLDLTQPVAVMFWRAGTSPTTARHSPITRALMDACPSGASVSRGTNVVTAARARLPRKTTTRAARAVLPAQPELIARFFDGWT